MKGWDKSRLKAKRAKNWLETAKKRAAMKAVRHVNNNFIIGLGSGTTAAYAIHEIGKMIRQKNWRIAGVPTSYQAFLLAIKCGISITTLKEHPLLDLNIDGADQIDPNLNMIKGMGGALTREKIVFFSSKQNIVVVDETKLTKKLGTGQPVPIEVLPFATALVESRIKTIMGKPVLRERRVNPLITDNGNFIIDVDFGPIDNPEELNIQLKSIPGVVETGLFLELANTVYVGTSADVHTFKRNRTIEYFNK